MSATTHAVVATAPDWRDALAQITAACPAPGYDLVFVFASSHHSAAYPQLIAALCDALHPGTLLGCSGQAIIGTATELESEPAISVMAMRLPGASLRPVQLQQADLEVMSSPAEFRILTGVEPDDLHAWVVFADPFTLDSDRLLAAIADAYPGVPVVGGMASALGPGGRGTSLFLNSETLPSGAVAVAVGGEWTIRAVVSQGAEPFGQTWTVTAAEENFVQSLGGRPALEILIETMNALPQAERERASRNLLVGLAIDEYRDEFRRGDFLIKNLAGVHQESGSLAIGALPRVGQTLQFQIRDAGAADDELRIMLSKADEELGETRPAGAIVCSCNGRGVGLFGTPNHDAAALQREFGELAAAGLFCNGELGPVGGKNFVHGFTASIGFFVPYEA